MPDGEWKSPSRPDSSTGEKDTRDRIPALVNSLRQICRNFNFSLSLVRSVCLLEQSHCAVARESKIAVSTFEDGKNSVRGDPPTGRDG